MKEGVRESALCRTAFVAVLKFEEKNIFAKFSANIWRNIGDNFSKTL